MIINKMQNMVSRTVASDPTKRLRTLMIASMLGVCNVCDEKKNVEFSEEKRECSAILEVALDCWDLKACASLTLPPAPHPPSGLLILLQPVLSTTLL